MTNHGTSLGTDMDQQILRRLDIVIGLLAVLTAFLGILVADLVSASFVPAFLVTLLFALGVVVLSKSLL